MWLCAGQGGGHVNYGPLYGGLPYGWLGFWGSATLNVPALYTQGLLNPAAHDAAACRRLYDDTFALLQSFDLPGGGMGQPLSASSPATPALQHAHASH